MAQRERDMEESSRRESQSQSRRRVEEIEDAEPDDPPPTKSLSKKAGESKPGPGPGPGPANSASVTADSVIGEEYEGYQEEEELEPDSADLMPDLPGLEAPRVAPSSPNPRHSPAEPAKRIGARRANADWEQEEPEMELAELDDIETHPTETPSPEARGVNVYDEYWELLKETREMPASGETPGGAPLEVWPETRFSPSRRFLNVDCRCNSGFLKRIAYTTMPYKTGLRLLGVARNPANGFPARLLDVNLLSSLVHWTSVAKRRVGEQQLRDILELYIQSRHSRPELQELLLHISTMVKESPDEPVEGPEQCVDLMFHLHGILTGGLPVVQIPQMQFASRSSSEVDGES